MSSSQNKPPLIGLLLRATIWSPVGIIITVVWLGSLGITFIAPIMGAVCIWGGDYLMGAGFILLSPIAFVIGRTIGGRVWEEPPSAL